jgi:hypothetical protein
MLSWEACCEGPGGHMHGRPSPWSPPFVIVDRYTLWSEFTGPLRPYTGAGWPACCTANRRRAAAAPHTALALRSTAFLDAPPLPPALLDANKAADSAASACEQRRPQPRAVGAWARVQCFRGQPTGLYSVDPRGCRPTGAVLPRAAHGALHTRLNAGCAACLLLSGWSCKRSLLGAGGPQLLTSRHCATLNWHQVEAHSRE